MLSFDVISVTAVLLLAILYLGRMWLRSIRSSGAGSCGSCPGGCSGAPHGAPPGGQPLGDLRRKG